jgi:hypothetical protein
MTRPPSLSTVAPAINALPQFLRENKYHSQLADPAHIPWYLAHATAEPIFKWISARPDVLKNFMGWMAGQRDGLPSFLSVVDFEREFATVGGAVNSETPVFVDVGGSMGHQCVAVRNTYPHLVGRVILQDLPTTVDKVRANPLPGFEGVEVMAHDIFMPQPIKGITPYSRFCSCHLHFIFSLVIRYLKSVWSTVYRED